jgi:hypothetical protein
MIVKGLEIPIDFVQLTQAIKQGGTHSFLPIGKIDAYGNLFEAPLALFTTARELHGWADGRYPSTGSPTSRRKSWRS